MRFSLLISLMLLSQSSFARYMVFPEAPTQFEITPMDPVSEGVLKTSTLSSHLTETTNDRVQFHKRAVTAVDKIKTIVSLKDHDDLFFIYDCLFLPETEFYLKYSDLSKSKLTVVRKTVWETFQK